MQSHPLLTELQTLLVLGLVKYILSWGSRPRPGNTGTGPSCPVDDRVGKKLIRVSTCVGTGQVSARPSGRPVPSQNIYTFIFFFQTNPVFSNPLPLGHGLGLRQFSLQCFSVSALSISFQPPSRQSLGTRHSAPVSALALFLFFPFGLSPSRRSLLLLHRSSSASASLHLPQFQF